MTGGIWVTLLGGDTLSRCRLLPTALRGSAEGHLGSCTHSQHVLLRAGKVQGGMLMATQTNEGWEQLLHSLLLPHAASCACFWLLKHGFFVPCWVSYSVRPQQLTTQGVPQQEATLDMMKWSHSTLKPQYSLFQEEWTQSSGWSRINKCVYSPNFTLWLNSKGFGFSAMTIHFSHRWPSPASSQASICTCQF